MAHRILVLVSFLGLMGIPLKTLAQPVVKIEGTVTYRYLAGLGMAIVNPVTGKQPLPINTKMELRVPDNGGWRVDKTLEVSTHGGDYSVLTHADPTDPFRLRVYLQTFKDRVAGTLRVNVDGCDTGPHWFETTTFTTATAAPGTPPTLTVDIHVGDDADSDGPIPNGFDMREMALAFGDWGEEGYARLAVALAGIDDAYRLVHASGRIPWLCDASWSAWYTHGQRVWCPPPPAFRFTAGVALPSTFEIHLNHTDGLTFEIASHEFGHIVHYHTTDIWELDLWWEVFNKWYPYWGKNVSTAKIAYAEGWAEYFATMHRHESVLTPTPTYSDWVENDTHPPRGLDWDYWKAADDDGTNNSGEIVMGAVAQAFWKFSPTGGSFADRIEDVWAAVRMGATAGSRNSRKTLKEFYDAIMVLHSGSPKQQEFRNICDVHGLVFSRMKLTEFEPVANSGAFVPATDNVWLSANSRLKAAPLTASELMVTGVVEAEVVGYQIHPPGSANPYVWVSVPYTDLTGPTWDGPDHTFTEVAEGYAVQGYRAILAAATAGLDNRYYLVRAAVKPPASGPAAGWWGPCWSQLWGNRTQGQGSLPVSGGVNWASTML